MGYAGHLLFEVIDIKVPYIVTRDSRDSSFNIKIKEEDLYNQPYEKKEENIMTTNNHSHAVFLLNPNIRAIIAIYEPEPFEGRPNPNNRTMFKTLDKELKVGDLIIVPADTRHHFTTMKVVEVDVEVDYNSSKEIKWVVSRIDVAAYERTIAVENQGIRKIKDHEARKKREELREALIGDDKELLAISLAVIDSTAVVKEEPPKKG